MNSIYDYIYLRGNITFTQSHLCEIDGLIFALLSNIEYNSIFRDFEISSSLTLTEVVERFQLNQEYTRLSEKTKFVRQNLLLLQNLCKYKRYSNVKIFGYKRDFNKEKYTQFSAISFLLDDNTLVVGYRGTDASLIGWKEDFAMSFKTSVGAQEDSAIYLNKIGSVNCKQIVTCGHSKGGNLAVYSAMNANKKIVSKIMHVYNFDGPGFNKKIFNSSNKSKLNINRITTIVPQSSMIGVLMEHQEPISVVYSSKKTGIFQHYPLSWEVANNQFRRLEDTNILSKNFNETSRLFLENLSESEMEKFLDCVFKVFDENGAVTFSDISRNPSRALKTFHQIHKEIPKESKDVLEVLLKSIIKSSMRVYSHPIMKGLHLYKCK